MYHLTIKINNCFKDDLDFYDFTSIDNVLNFLNVFMNHCNTICKYTIIEQE